jgi:hypothetical protein
MKIKKFIDVFLSKLVEEVFNFLKNLLLFVFGYYVVYVTWRSGLSGKIILIFTLIFLLISSAISAWDTIKRDRARELKKETINWN